MGSGSSRFCSYSGAGLNSSLRFASSIGHEDIKLGGGGVCEARGACSERNRGKETDSDSGRDSNPVCHAYSEGGESVENLVSCVVRYLRLLLISGISH